MHGQKGFEVNKITNPLALAAAYPFHALMQILIK